MFEFLSFLIFPFFGALKSESYPDKLSLEDENKYLELMKNGDKNARGKLIEHNLRLVAHIVKKLDYSNDERDDLLSIGIIGLIKAVDTFNFDCNNKLGTYASKCIENEILMYFRSNKNQYKTSYLNSPIGFDKEGNEICLIDIVKDENADIEQKFILSKSKENLFNSLNVLSKRELSIIEMRYGINNAQIKTQKEIAKLYKISRSYVSRIEKRALMKLYRVLIDNNNNN